MGFDIETSIGHKIVALVKSKRELIDIAMDRLQLSRTQWQIMVKFCMLDMPCTQAKLLTLLEIDRAHLARSLGQLEHRELIKRESVKSDRRISEVQLTQKGESLLKKVQEIMRDEANILLKNITLEEQQNFKAILNKISNNILTELKNKKEKNGTTTN